MYSQPASIICGVVVTCTAVPIAAFRVAAGDDVATILNWL